jgi:hypothetical protein
MNKRSLARLLCLATAGGALSLGPATAFADAAAATVCITMPKAQLGQGNNAPTDVSEPVRAALGTYMAGPAVQLKLLDARIPIQIDAEAAQKECGYVLQSSVTQKKGKSAGGFFKKIAPLASALPMVGAAGGSMSGAIAAQAVAATASSAAAQSMQDDYMAAMTGAQQSNVKAGDVVTVEYQLSKPGDGAAPRAEKFETKAKADGEDVLGPLLERVATAVLTQVTTG